MTNMLKMRNIPWTCPYGQWPSQLSAVRAVSAPKIDFFPFGAVARSRILIFFPGQAIRNSKCPKTTLFPDSRRPTFDKKGLRVPRGLGNWTSRCKFFWISGFSGILWVLVTFRKSSEIFPGHRWDSMKRRVRGGYAEIII